MKIIWDEEKNRKLITERSLSFDTFSDLILDKKYREILKNPARPGQMLFIVPYQGYTYVVPFIVDTDKNIVLKTIFPSRKYHKQYGGKNNEDKT